MDLKLWGCWSWRGQFGHDRTGQAHPPGGGVWGTQASFRQKWVVAGKGWPEARAWGGEDTAEVTEGS